MPLMAPMMRSPALKTPKPPAVTSCGAGSVQPYGETNGYASFNSGRTGLIGPPADSLRQPTSWYVRTSGSNNNGGSSSGTSAERTGTDGSTTSGSLTFTSVSGAFTPADIGKGICIQNATFCYAKITAINSATSVQLSNPPSATAGSLSWSIGGAWANLLPVLNCSAFANTTCGVASGDTVYVGAGTYRNVFTLGTNFGALWNATGGTTKKTFDNFNGQANIVGDVGGSKTGDAGMVQLTAYTTNDKSGPAAALLNLAGKSNLLFSNIMFVGGSSILVQATTATSQNITFRDCSFLQAYINAGSTFAFTNARTVPFALLIDRCLIFAPQTANNTCVVITAATTTAQQDFSTNVVINNTAIIHPRAEGIHLSGTAGTGKPGGLKATNCFIVAGTVMSTATGTSTKLPMVITGSVCFAGSTGMAATNLGEVLESYNLIVATTARSNVAVGAGSVSDGSYAPLLHFGQETQWGGLLRRFGEPMSGSPLLGFGSRDPVASNPFDLTGRPRPAGLGAAGSQLPSVGALERSNTSTQATTPAPPSGTYVWKLTGPGYQEFSLPVDTAATTISCTVQRDAAYDAGPLNTMPSLSVLANPTIGVTAATVYDTGAVTTNNTLTLPAFAATAVGAVTVRVRSQDMSGTSVVAFSVFTIT